MSNAATPNWPQIEPYKSIIHALEVLEDRGFTVEQLIEGSYVVATAMEARAYGPRAVAIRCRAIADRYTQEAARASN
jgi:hypothetical protein